MLFSLGISQLILVCAALLAILWSDGSVGVQVSLWVLYCLPIALMTWNRGAKVGALIAAAATGLLVLTGLLWGHLTDSWWYFGISVTSKAVIYLSLVLLIGALRKEHVERIFTPPNGR